MKKLVLLKFAVILSACLFVLGCPGEEDSALNTPTVDNSENQFAGKILILQAYGNGNGGSPEGVSHSFVELYNVTNNAISLNGISLYYADGHRDTEEGFADNADKSWKKIALSGTIPAKGSFLILGKKHADTTSTRYKIEDTYRDIYDDNLVLSRRAFKVAIIESTAELTVQNPFNTDGAGTIMDGYIDMVGAANTYPDTDSIYGFELYPARCSASAAVRRGSLTDTNDNSADFIAARYGATSGNNISLTDEELEVCYPRKSSAGSWNPFESPSLPQQPPPTEAGEPSEYAGKLLILQIGAGNNDDSSNVTRSFVELYNSSNETINLEDITLQYAEGTNVSANAETDGKWQKIELNGEIEAGRSFLVFGEKISTMPKPALDFDGDNYADMYVPTFRLNNRAVKVALIEGTDTLTVQNPFNMNAEKEKAAGYIDMIGVVNDATTDQILGLEGELSFITGQYRITKQVGVRRTSLTDTDVNSDDFRTVTYTSLTIGQKEVMRPKNHAHGAWDPFAEPVEPPPPETPIAESLMILQANTHGNASGGFAKSLVELYNNSDDEIDLDAGNYYLHIGDNNDPGWTNVIKLTGTIPSKCSYLIVSNNATGNATPRAVLPVADQEADFVLTNDGFKVLLMINKDEILTVANPSAEVSLFDNYIDMLCISTSKGFEQVGASQSRPQITRRNSLTDNNKNSTDFTQTDIRTTAMSNDQLYKYWPRNSTMGEWNPITGLPQIDPAP